MDTQFLFTNLVKNFMTFEFVQKIGLYKLLTKTENITYHIEPVRKQPIKNLEKVNKCS